MRLTRLWVLLLIAFPPCLAGEAGPRMMSGWFSATSNEGWTGKRYLDGREMVAEEFDTNGDSRIDLWRFYRRGVLSSEERDLTFDGRINLQTRWDTRTGRLASLSRDKRGQGVNDLEVRFLGGSRWEAREDRNGDGVADRILLFAVAPDIFENLGIDLVADDNVVELIPIERWIELASDDGFTGDITERRRYSRGVSVARGEWDGRRVVWRRDARPATAAAPPSRTRSRGSDETAGQTGILPGDGVPESPDELASIAPSTRDGYFPEATASRRDRTRYEGIPPGESFARALPVRMRQPGETARR